MAFLLALMHLYLEGDGENGGSRIGSGEQDGGVPRIKPLEGARPRGGGAEGVGRRLPIVPAEVSQSDKA